MSDSGKKINFVFFGTSEFSVYILDALKERGLLPICIVSTPDRPQGRKLVLTPTKTKDWALENSIKCIQPESLKEESTAKELTFFDADVFVVASYGKIIPQNILDIPKHKTLNVHPSLLPRLRGASPIQTAILSEEKTGVSIMRLDDKMDHGPIIAQKEIGFSVWPEKYEVVEKTLGGAGGDMLAEILPEWVAGKISEKEQDHDLATYTKKIEKNDGLISLSDNAEENLRKIMAFSVWPGTFFFAEKDGKEVRVVIKEAKITDGALEIIRVIPEGKKEMLYRDFLRNGFFLKGV